MTANALKTPAKGWPPERRAAQSARLRAAKIWQKSTGPRTPEGKSVSRQNSCLPGSANDKRRQCKARLKQVAAALRAQRNYMQQYRFYLKFDPVWQKHPRIRQSLQQTGLTALRLLSLFLLDERDPLLNRVVCDIWVSLHRRVV